MDTVSQPVVLQMFSERQQYGHALRAALAYDRKEPYEVRVLFPAGLEHLDLVLARDLLASGLTGPATYGGIRVWPNHDQYWAVCIGWTDPAGHARVEVRAAAVAHFLNLTYYLVPQGTEPPRTDIDTVIAAILNGGGPSVNETSARSPTPVSVPPGGPWTLHTREPGDGTRPWVTASCTRCGAALWDELLGMTITFAGIEQARQELPGLGWAVSAPRGGAEQVLCPGCAARTVS
jgi:hypothetical protein